MCLLCNPIPFPGSNNVCHACSLFPCRAGRNNRKDADSELDTDSDSESDPEDNVPLDFDALDGDGNGEEDVAEDSSASSDEDNAEPPFSEQHDFGDDENVSAEAICKGEYNTRWFLSDPRARNTV